MSSDNPGISGLDFGVVIAFVAPGFVALQAAASYVHTVAQWMAAASEKEQSIGVFLFVLLASLSVGLAVSGVRALLVDGLLRWSFWGKCAVPQLNLDWSKVDDKTLPVLVTIRDAHYRFYQFYSNTLVALVFWMVSHVLSRSSTAPWHWQRWALIGSTTLLLLLSAHNSCRRYTDGVNKLLNFKP